MSESFNLMRRASSLDISKEIPGYSGVVIYAGQDVDGNDVEYRAGDNSGTVLEVSNEWGSQAQADYIYRLIRGYKYQPYSVEGAFLDPSAELGDAVAVSDIYGGIFSKITTYGRSIVSDIGAPSKEEVEHEFLIKSPETRRFERTTRELRAGISLTSAKISAEVEDRQATDNLLRATLNVQAEQIYAEVEERKKSDELLRATLNLQAQYIEAKVSKEGGNTASDFWWKLLSTGWDAGTGSKTVFSVKKSGAYVDGEIRATSGKIGGFDIQSNYLSYNGQTWGGTNTTGIYAGPNGIQCGSASNGVQITSNGNLYAENGYFRGSVNAGNIQYGGSAGYLSGSGLASHSVYGSQIGYNTISTAYTSGGINTSLGYADFANGVFNNYNKADYVVCRRLDADYSAHLPQNLWLKNGDTYYQVRPKNISINGSVYRVLTI